MEHTLIDNNYGADNNESKSRNTPAFNDLNNRSGSAFNLQASNGSQQQVVDMNGAT